MPYFGQEIFEKAEAKGPLTEKAYLDALEKDLRADPQGGHRQDDGREQARRARRADERSGEADRSRQRRLRRRRQLLASRRSPATRTSPFRAASKFGLPVGMSIFGRPWSEPTLLRIAYAYEQATKHRRAPKFLPTADLVASAPEVAGIRARRRSLGSSCGRSGCAASSCSPRRLAAAAQLRTAARPGDGPRPVVEVTLHATRRARESRSAASAPGTCASSWTATTSPIESFDWVTNESVASPGEAAAPAESRRRVRRRATPSAERRRPGACSSSSSSGTSRARRSKGTSGCRARRSSSSTRSRPTTASPSRRSARGSGFARTSRTTASSCARPSRTRSLSRTRRRRAGPAVALGDRCTTAPTRRRSRRRSSPSAMRCGRCRARRRSSSSAGASASSTS